MRLQFLGANRQVTGSHYLLDAGSLRVVIDCGLFQERKLLGRNWQQPTFDPKSIDLMLLTHAHLDHTGLVPRLVANGFDGPIICTEPTTELARIIMLDSAKIHEEDVAYKKKRHRKEKRKGRYPLIPLYTSEDAAKAVTMLQGDRYGKPIKLNDKLTVTFHEAGHILGSAILELTTTANGQTKRVVFSGDLGQDDKPLIRDPAPMEHADYVVMESTYGDKNHRNAGDVQTQLADVVNDTVQRGGNLVIPTFAVERAQELIYHLGQLVRQNRIPKLPIFLDSPMAVNVTEVFRDYRDYMDEKASTIFTQGNAPLKFPGLKLVRSVDESIAINSVKGPCIIMSASGMCTGGRIKHHLRHNISNRNCTILFVGYQAVGSLGRLILEGKQAVRIHRHNHPVRARIAQIHGFSAHGDQDDLVAWLGHFKNTPKHLFLTHGDEDAATTLAGIIQTKLGWNVSVPEYQDSVDLI